MKMTIKYISIFVVCISLFSCTNTNYADCYRIECKNKKIKVNEIYEAEICLLKIEDIDTNIRPIFYIVSNMSDTFYLPYNKVKYCATYRGIARKVGNVKWNGTFEYKTKHNKDVKVSFSDTYIVE
jgi:hypothetical protein